MNDEKLKAQLGANIASYRKRLRLTQAALAEKINFSDKAVSKWERGESIPDLPTIVLLAELFEVTVDDLLIDPDALPANTGKVEQVMSMAMEKTLKRKANKKAILGLTSMLVWFVALLAYVVCSSLDLRNSWLAFLYAIPVNSLVLLILRSAWKDFRWNQTLVSGIVWGSLVSLYITLLVLIGWTGGWKLLLLGIPGQLAIFFWFRLFRGNREEKNG